MARCERWLTGQVRSYKDATRTIFNRGSQRSSEQAVLRYWPHLHEFAAWLDTRRAESTAIESGRPVRFARGGLLFFYVAALVLNKPMTEAYTFVQESMPLRQRLAAQYGWPVPTEETLARIASARGADEVPEDGFPSRQTVANLIRWLNRW